ncbi:DUF2142 domain-containing protein [Trueperella pecoris]|uniref:DUF2142 domain-containing protein n=1 Tax=Trueperella pecoris TaxID=2733571 RepID=A0A7M1R1X8_9ACTO|nr:DUF2142 domain-containing protein [Trueperella pecoris]QOR48300.1 DUF2142 domain-containing protein [Trueperella pecoris]
MSEMKDTANSKSRNGLRRWLLMALLVVSLVGTGLSWILASPIGGSPDDDFHMGSVWCPRPAEESCETAVIDGVLNIKVPEPVALAPKCHIMQPDKPASCERPLDSRVDAYSPRFDLGSYPTFYYRFHHLLIMESVDASIILMRAVNYLIAVLMLGTIAVLLERKLRYPYLLAMVASWAPMGIYFLASMNPSSWSITGVFSYATAMWGAFEARDERRRWALTGMALLGALLCFGSRGDAAFYIFVVTMGLLFAIAKKRRDLPQWAMGGLLSMIGIYMMGSGGQVDNVVSSNNYVASPLSAGIRTLMDLPRFFAGLVGFEYGPGWFDIPLNGTVVVLAVILMGTVFFVGLRQGSWRKWMSATMILGAMSGIPVLMVAMGYFTRLGIYQPRYILPLLAVLMFFLLASDGGLRPRLSIAQEVFIFASFAVVVSYTLHIVLRRYVTGLGPIVPFNLDTSIGWWWDTSISPTTTWLIGTVSIILAVVLGRMLARPVSVEEIVALDDDRADRSRDGVASRAGAQEHEEDDAVILVAAPSQLP